MISFSRCGWREAIWNWAGERGIRVIPVTRRRPLGLGQAVLALALVGFNHGVEAGQIAIVSAFLPLAYLLRQTSLYRSLVLIGGSSVIVAVAAVWFVERAFDLKFLPVH